MSTPAQPPRSRRALTRNQRQVLDALRQAHGAITAYALLRLLRPLGFTAPTQIYRALARLIAAGAAHRLESLNAYVACSGGDLGRTCSAFTICDRCGGVIEIVDDALERSLQRCVGDRGFRLARPTIEVRGTCAVCAAGEGGDAGPTAKTCGFSTTRRAADGPTSAREKPAL